MLNTLMRIRRFSVITLYQHYFPADDERLFGEAGERVGEELLKRWGDGAERHVVESGTNKKEPRRFLFKAL